MGIEGIGGPLSITMSPDGANVYVTSITSDDDTIGVFRRDPATYLADLEERCLQLSLPP